MRGVHYMAAADVRRTSRIKVLYILGWGRSGSTILDNVLGQVDGFFTTGEMHYVWDHLREKRPCGCGKLINDCPVWSPVSTAVLEEPFHGGVTVDQIVELQKSELRLRHTVRLMRKDGQLPNRDALRRYAGVADALYRQIARHTGARVVIDSTKRPPDGALLRLLPNVDAYVVHLVRDPRAVAYSWQRRRQQLDRPTEMDRYGALGSSINWLTWNGASEVIRRQNGAGKSLLLRYEDFIASPEDSVRRLIDLVGEPSTRLPFVHSSAVELETNHSVAGNPRRFQTGRVELRKDDEWRIKQSPASRLIATTVALPLLRRYRYSLMAPPAPTTPLKHP